jgi:hypothetical protein
VDLRQRVLSDVPGAALLFACLVFEQRARSHPSVRNDLLLGAMIGVGTYLRTAHVFLLPAILLYRFVAWYPNRGEQTTLTRFIKSQAVMLTTMTILLMLPWSLRNRLQDVPTPTENLAVHSYSAGMWHVDPGDPSSPLITSEDMLERVPLRLDGVLSVLGSRLRGRTWEADTKRVVVVAMMSWLVILWRRREPAEFYFGAMFAVLAVYFGFVLRLVLPLYMLALVNVAEVAKLLVERVAGSRAAQATVAMALVALAVVDFDLAGVDKIAKRHERLNAVVDYIEINFPADAVVAAPNGRHLAVLLDRPVYTLEPAYRRDGAARVEEILRQRDVDVIVAVHGPGEAELRELAERHASHIDRLPGFSVFTVAD